MLPISLDLSQVPVLLAGAGPIAVKRLALLDQAGARAVTVCGRPDDAALVAAAGDRFQGRMPGEADVAAAGVVFLAGLDRSETDRLAALARAQGRLVNSEDDRPNCDFHVPALVRRGGLVLAISTEGTAPGLARRLRQELEVQFGPEWADRLQEVGKARQGWRDAGLSLPEVSRKVDEYIDQKGWFS